MAALQGAQGFATAFESDEAHALGLDARGTGQQGGFHPVLAADGAARAQHDLGRIGLHGLHHVGQRAVGRVVRHHHRAVVRAYGRQPAHVVFAVAPELALGQVEQGAAGEGHDGVGLVGVLRDHRAVGQRTDAAGQIAHAHGLGDELPLQQAALRQLAAQIEAAAGLGRRNAFGLVQGAGRGQARGHGQPGEKNPVFHGASIYTACGAQGARRAT
ncbi:hypothetical protein D3C78_1123390 [compost metagenome]